MHTEEQRDTGDESPEVTPATESDSTTHARTWERIWVPAFLAYLSQTAHVVGACQAAKIDRSTVYDYKSQSPEFAKAWEDALDQAVEILEREARRRAVEGVEEPVFGRVAKDKDGQVGTVRKYSDSLLTTLLKAHKPEKYRERVSAEITGKGGAPLFQGSDEELERRIRELETALGAKVAEGGEAPAS